MTAPPIKNVQVLTCHHKMRWSDEMAARAGAMMSLERKGQDLIFLSVYHCPNCRGWHLTKKKNKQYMVQRESDSP